jgi:hypothetical protein
LYHFCPLLKHLNQNKNNENQRFFSMFFKNRCFSPLIIDISKKD